MLLKLAIWKTKIKDQIGMLNDLLTTEKKMQCRIDSISIVKYSSKCTVVPLTENPFYNLDDLWRYHTNGVIVKSINSSSLAKPASFYFVHFLAIEDSRPR
jgi:hypothetical protein